MNHLHLPQGDLQEPEPTQNLPHEFLHLFLTKGIFLKNINKMADWLNEYLLISTHMSRRAVVILFTFRTATSITIVNTFSITCAPSTIALLVFALVDNEWNVSKQRETQLNI